MNMAAIKMGVAGLFLCVACMVLMHLYEVDVAALAKFLGLRQWPQDRSNPSETSGDGLQSPSSIKEFMFTADELAEYDGRRGLYLSILGQVFDVEKGARHYATGGAYHGFTGRDASRAFVTGDFTKEGLRDDVLDLQLDSLLSLQKWLTTYRDNYKYVGKLIGRYYTTTGELTDYSRELQAAFGRAEEEKQRREAKRIRYPPCNTEWHQETGQRVWCTKLSGGIQRDWVGHPRQMYSAGGSEPQCVCVQKPDIQSANLKTYPSCPNDSTSCKAMYLLSMGLFKVNLVTTGSLGLSRRVPRMFRSNFMSDFTASEAVENQMKDQVVGICEVTESAETCTVDLKSRLTALQMEMDSWRCKCGYKLPSKLTDVQWMDALHRESRSQRLKFYKFLRKKERRAARLAEKKKLAKTTVITDESDEDVPKRPYLLVNQKMINNAIGLWHCEALQFGPDLVIDLSFDENMLQRESANCAQQILGAYHCNRQNRYPFHLHLCNARDEQPTVGYLRRYLKNWCLPDCLMAVHRCSYLGLFPNKRIVYLTADCDDELTEYDSDSVYVIGGIVSTTHNKPLSLQKATREGLAMAKLPLDKYLRLENRGLQSLTLDQMVNVMLDLKLTGDFNVAFKHVPRRKLKT